MGNGVDPGRRKNTERGATVVEFAVLAALFLVIVFGLLEFGIIFFQNHYVAGAAREGMRTGVIANNYECFESGACTTSRFDTVCEEVTNYLSVVFDTNPISCTSVRSLETGPNTINIWRDPEAEDDGNEPVELLVTVRITNFMPPLITGLVPGYTSPDDFIKTTIGTYEDPSEL